MIFSAHIREVGNEMIVSIVPPGIGDCPDVVPRLAPHGFSAGNSNVVVGVVQRDLVILGGSPPKISGGNVQAFFIALKRQK